MTLEWIALGLSILSGASSCERPTSRACFAPEYRSAERAVDNWRSARRAEPGSRAGKGAGALRSARDLRDLSRCVRLNNYWCVKKAGWTGEIAADNEGPCRLSPPPPKGGRRSAIAATLLHRFRPAFGARHRTALKPAQCVAPLTYHAPGALHRRP